MKHRFYKAVALLMALAMLLGLALSEEVPEEFGKEVDFGSEEENAGFEIDEEVIFTEPVDEMPDEVDLALTLEDIDLRADATYRFVVDGEEYAIQVARAGDEILRPEDPEAPKGKVFAGWTLVDGTPLFVDADEDGEIDPVIVRDEEMGTDVYVWAEFADPAEAEEPAEVPAEEQPADEKPTEEPAEEEPAEEEPAEEELAEEEPAEEEPAEEEPAEEEPAEDEPAEEQPAEEPAEEEPAEEEHAEEPAEEESAEEEAAAEPAEEEPAEQEPAEEEPAAEESAVESIEEPAEEQPVEEPAEEPVAEEPAEEEPIVEPTANALTYTGEAQALVYGEGAWLYSLDGETYGEEIPTAVNAGEYTVYFKATEADEPQSITVTVAKADAEFTPPVAAVAE